MRAVAGLILALGAILVAAPAPLVPWAGPVHALLPRWWELPVCATGLLVIAALLIPAGAEAPARNRPGLAALGVGLLFLLEPLLHLGSLAQLGWSPLPQGDLLILPYPVALTDRALLVQVAVLGLAVPIGEELLFRGRLQPWLAARLGPGAAIGISTLAFAAAHADPMRALVALPIGLLLGLLRHHGRDLGACVLVHQVHNGLFILAGPALIITPLVGLILACAGLLLLALAVGVLGGPEGRRRRLAWTLAATAALAAAMPLHRGALDRAWASAAATLTVRGSLPDRDLLLRLDALRRRGWLPAARGRLLAARLDAVPRHGHRLQMDRIRQVRCLADPAGSVSGLDDEDWDRLLALAAAPLRSTALAEAALALGAAHPDLFAAAAIAEPGALRRWLPLPEAAPAAAGQLAVSHGPDRKRLLAALERAWPGGVAEVLFHLRPDEVDHLDRRFLRANYPDYEQRLVRLSRRDPALATAFASQR